MSKILVLNPGSTSTKIAMFRDREQLWQRNIEHDAAEIKAYPTIFSQLSFRTETVKQAVAEHGDALTDVSCILLAEGVRLDDELIKVAEQKGINVIGTDLPIYEAALAVRGIGNE